MQILRGFAHCRAIGQVLSHPRCTRSAGLVRRHLRGRAPLRGSRHSLRTIARCRYQNHKSEHDQEYCCLCGCGDAQVTGNAAEVLQSIPHRCRQPKSRFGQLSGRYLRQTDCSAKGSVLTSSGRGNLDTNGRRRNVGLRWNADRFGCTYWLRCQRCGSRQIVAYIARLPVPVLRHRTVLRVQLSSVRPHS